MADHQRRDDRRIDAAGKVAADRHVGDHAPLDGPVQMLLGPLQVMGLAPVLLGLGNGELPIGAALNVAVLEYDDVGLKHVELMTHDGLAMQRQQALGDFQRPWVQAGRQAGGQDDGFHDGTLVFSG